MSGQTKECAFETYVDELLLQPGFSGVSCRSRARVRWHSVARTWISTGSPGADHCRGPRRTKHSQPRCDVGITARARGYRAQIYDMSLQSERVGRVFSCLRHRSPGGSSEEKGAVREESFQWWHRIRRSPN